MRIKVGTNQGAVSFCYNMGNFGYLKNIPLTNQWPECINIRYEATLGQGDSSLCK